MNHACMLIYIYIDRLCRITFRNVKVRDEKITRCDRHALITHAHILCARVLRSASAINTLACVESKKQYIILY